MKIFFALFFAVTSSAFAGWKVSETPGKHIDVMDGDGKLVARVMTAHDLSSKESRLETYKVYTHLYDQTGKEFITKGAGGAFTHHRGLFIGWSKTRFDGKGVDSWHMKGCTQEYQKILAEDTEDDHAKLAILIHWKTDDGKVFIEEQREQIFRRVDGDGAYVEVDFRTTLKAPMADVELNGDPEHAGFQFRPSNAVAENKSAKYLFHEDGIDPKMMKDLPWVAESFKIGDTQYFAQHMCHSDAIPKGNTYSAYRDYGRFGAYFVKTIPKGESLMLAYRVTVGEGELPAREAFAKRHQQFMER